MDRPFFPSDIKTLSHNLAKNSCSPWREKNHFLFTVAKNTAHTAAWQDLPAGFHRKKELGSADMLP
jgi:hypothetical protein